MNAEDKRAQRLQLLDDPIGRSLRQIESSSELVAARRWGKPLNFGDGYDEAPLELRMALELLKDAGIVPREVEMMRELCLRKRISEMQQAIALRLETLRINGSL